MSTCRYCDGSGSCDGVACQACCGSGTDSELNPDAPTKRKPKKYDVLGERPFANRSIVKVYAVTKTGTKFTGQVTVYTDNQEKVFAVVRDTLRSAYKEGQ